MTTVFKVLGIALLIGGLLLWTVSVLPSFSLFSLNSSNEQLVASPLPAVDDGYTTLTGTIIYDKNTTPSVPYILYRLSDGNPRTKQLILRGHSGCAPAAGDIKCPLGDSFPNVSEGTGIRVTGTINGDQILVDNLEQA
jgi:hypothetical protein